MTMTDTQWKVFEVFHQQVRGEPHVHVGSIHAPDAEVALILAKEQYGRRQACVSFWVVPADAIRATDYENADIFDHGTDKSYRESFGYETTKRVRGRKVGRVLPASANRASESQEAGQARPIT